MNSATDRPDRWQSGLVVIGLASLVHAVCGAWETLERIERKLGDRAAPP